MKFFLGKVVLVGLLFACATAGAERQYAWLRGWDGHGQSFDLSALRGQVVALTFASKKTRDEATDVNEELVRHAVAGQVTVVSVVDLEDIPSYGYGIARKKIAQSDRPGTLRHLVDEHGALRRSFSVDPRKQVDIFVIGRDGAVLGHYVGESGVDEANKLIEELK